jgi:archaellum biogenesis protein FlaJ (TadC family)
MTDIVLTLVFSVVMLVFMAFPAMKIVEFIKTKSDFSKKVYDVLQILFTIVLSLLIGIFLKFA